MRRLARMTAVAAVAVAMMALTTACTNFESPSIVIDLRVLGMQVVVQGTPPEDSDAEVVVDFDLENIEGTQFPIVGVTALVADPGVERKLAWSMTACAPTRSLRCEDPEALFVNMGTGVVEDPDGALAQPDGVRASLDISIPLLQEAIQLDSLAGFGGIAIQVELCVRPEGTTCADAGVFASKRIVYAPRLPPMRTPNQNPSLAGLMADDVNFPAPVGMVGPYGPACRDAGTMPLVVTAGQLVVLRPIEPDGVRETYMLPTFDGGVRTITENLRYSWFATAGAFSPETSGGPIDLFGNIPTLDTTWEAPSADRLADFPDGKIALWLVQRDERGGTRWSERCILVVR